MQHYLRPVQLAQALAALADGPATVVAGATDFYPSRPVPTDENIVDITALPGLRAIEHRTDGWFVPCLATWSDVIAAPLPPCLDALKQAARQVGGMQIQNAGTVLGNLCNASPAADGVPCALALDASVELVSLRGRRVMPLADFIQSPRRTRRLADELAVGLHIPDRGGSSRFEKLGARAYLVISIAMVAAWVRLDGDRIAAARLAVGACGPRAVLLHDLAYSLVGQICASAKIEPEYLAHLTPIDDIRAPAAYRREAALVLVRRAVRGLAPAKGADCMTPPAKARTA